MMATVTEPVVLTVSWSVSRGRETYGYNICRLDDMSTGKRYRCSGGGYDMLGTVFAAWLQRTHEDELRAIADRAHIVYGSIGPDGLPYVKNDDGLYGMIVTGGGTVRLDGACGLSSIERIAEAIGLKVRHTVNRKGHTVGFVVTAVQ